MELKIKQRWNERRAGALNFGRFLYVSIPNSSIKKGNIIRIGEKFYNIIEIEGALGYSCDDQFIAIDEKEEYETYSVFRDLDFQKKVLEQFDFLIGSRIIKAQQDEDEEEERFVRVTLENGDVFWVRNSIEFCEKLLQERILSIRLYFHPMFGQVCIQAKYKDKEGGIHFPLGIKLR